MGDKALLVLDFATGVMDDEGNPISGGLVYFYEAGTTTPLAVYTDRDKTTPASSPVVLDTYGRAEVYADGMYKVVVQDSDASSVWDVDNVELVSLSGVDFNNVDIGQTTPGKVKATELEFTTSITDSASNTFTNLATELGGRIAFYGQTFNAGLTVGAPVKYTSSAKWEATSLSDQHLVIGVVIDITDNIVVTHGSATGLSGLTAGSEYYLQDDGSIGTTVTAISLGVAKSTTELYVNINVAEYDVYNFEVDYPYAQTADTYSECIRKQMAYRAGEIVSIKAYFGTVRTGSPTGANEIDIVNNGTQVLGAASTDDTYDNLIATSAEEITSFASGATVVAGNYLGVHIDELRVDGTGEQADLFIQVRVRVEE